MGDKKIQQVVISDQQGTATVVTREYFQIWFTDIMINKRFFKYWTGIVFVATQILFGVVLGLEVIGAFYWTLLMAYVDFNLAHWVIIPIQLAFIGAVIGVLWIKHKKHMTVKELNRLETLRRQSNTNTVDTRGGEYWKDE